MNGRKMWMLITVTLLLAVTGMHAQQVTISNNLLYDAWLTPNLRVGVRLAPHWSVGVNGGYRPWPTDDMKTRKWKHLLVSPDVRYWTDSVNVHHFFGLNLIYSHYNIANVKFPLGMWKSLRHERREGDLGAIGAYYGYSWPIARHWNIEAHIGAALAYTRYDKFECGHCGKKLGEKKKLFVLPQAGLSIVYNLPGRPRKVEQPTLVAAEVQPEPVLPTAEVAVVEPFIPVVHPVVDFEGVAGTLQKTNPVVTHISAYKPYDRTRILRKEKDALFVHFALGRSALDAGYRNNQQTLDRIVDITQKIMADSVSEVKKIQIIGLASVEGLPATNERLATNRALALQHYIQQQVNVPDSLFDTVGGGEAWADFRDHLQDLAASDSQQAEQLKEAISIIDQEKNSRTREWKIKQLDGGRTWQYLKEHVLNEQRNAGYIRIYFDHVPDLAAAIINEASQLLASGRYQEALQKLQTVSNDERAQNALGVALWQTGKKIEALRAFRRAADTGNKDAQENLRQLEGRM